MQKHVPGSLLRRRDYLRTHRIVNGLRIQQVRAVSLFRRCSRVPPQRASATVVRPYHNELSATAFVASYA
jgi:hypothetical protein